MNYLNVLAIGAHFDDVELGCGGTLLRHKINGDNIYILVITSSDYTSVTNNHIRTSETAFYEGIKSSKILGSQLITGKFKTLELTVSKELINFLCEQIKKLNLI